jgi:hypothetical protein
MFYSTIHEQETAGETRVANEGLIRETACAIVGKLKSGEVTPLDLLEVLEKRIAEVDGHPVLCRQGSITVASFHPELSGDNRIHERFLQEV